MIDFHCHVDLYAEPVSILEQADQLGVYILAVTTTPKAWAGTCRLVANNKRARVALGLHPELVAERYNEVDLLIRLLPAAKYVGEIGLDGSSQYRSSFKQQEIVFKRILTACSEAGGRILSIHTRAAVSDVLDALEAEPNSGVPILHWFSGTQSQLDRAVKLGCWFSVGPNMLRSKKGKALVSSMPRERVLTETDAPFAHEDGRPLMPWDVQIGIKRLSEVWGMEPAASNEQIMGNLRNLVGSWNK